MFTVVHESPWPDGTVFRDTSASISDKPDFNHLAYCKAMQEGGRRGSEGRYFLAALIELDDNGKPIDSVVEHVARSLFIRDQYGPAGPAMDYEGDPWEQTDEDTRENYRNWYREVIQQLVAPQ